MKKHGVLLTAVFLAVSLCACGGKKGEADRNRVGNAESAVLATVNGEPITEHDMRHRLRASAHGEGMNPDSDQAVLETLVRDELVYQESLKLGLDRNPEYRRKLLEAEAWLRALQRQEMAALFREHTRKSAEVTEVEARKYFEENSQRIQASFHVFQISYKGDRARIAEAHEDLKRGVAFEKVAAKRFPGLPREMRAPWDLGYLHWSQVPPPWQGIVDRMEPGQVSDVIEGPGERFWIVKLVDRTVDPNITFEAEKERILAELRKRKAGELHDTMIEAMRTKSKIVLMRE